MSKQSEAVKRWRLNCKLRIIEAMGGSCCICGYNKCFASLALHHLDPKEKDFNFGEVMANPKSWDTLVAELRKCVLICHNCHNEVHNGFSEVPENYPRFDEKFADYRVLKKRIKEEESKPIFNSCPVCGKSKPAHLINCSRECAARSKFKVDWDKVDLEKELETKSIVQLAEELGCSDAAIHKKLKRIRGGSTETRKFLPTLIKNCGFCNKEIKVFGSAERDVNFCDKECRNKYVYSFGWPTDEELLEMRKNFSVKEIAEKLNKGKSSVYDRLSEILKGAA